MNGSELKTFAENIIDDTIDQDLFIDLLNNAKDYVESLRDWEILKKIDTSKSTAAGDTYTTAKALPTDFLSPRTVFIGTLKYEGIPMELRERYKSSGARFYIDYANNNLYITGSSQTGQTITTTYIYKTTDWTAANLASLEPVYPDKFHKLLGFAVAEIHSGAIDVDDIQMRQNQFQNKHAQILLTSMEMWDNRLKLNAMNYSAAPNNLEAGQVGDPDIISGV